MTHGTILIVEDAETCAAMLEIALIAADLDVTLASTGIDALLALGNRGRPVQAVITDLNMPRMDGFELIRRIRGEEATIARLPIIVISGDSDPETPARVTALGADAYFSKPYSPAMVLRTLKQLLDSNLAR